MQTLTRETGGALAAAQGRSRPARHVGVYLLLAALLAVVLSGSLFVYHRDVTNYRQAVETGRLLAMEIEGYHRLEASIAEAVAPGRDVFASADPALEAGRHQSARAKYENTFAEVRDIITAAESPQAIPDRRTVLGKIDGLMTELSLVTRETLTLFGAGRMTDALDRMAEMNRLQDEIRLTMIPLHAHARALQRSNLEQQAELTSEMRILTYLIGAFLTLVLLALVIQVYGLRRRIAGAGIEPATLRQDRGDVKSGAAEIAHRRQAQDEPRAEGSEAEPAIDSRSRFIASASHDLRQPLHAISLYLDLLRDRVQDPDALATVDAAIASNESLCAMINSLMEISKLDAGMVDVDIKPVPVLDVFDRLATELSPQAAEYGIEIRIVPTNIWVESDPILLYAMLQHLLSNALRYTQAGRVVVGARRRGGRVRIEVWDTGRGIAENKQSRIFEEYFRAGEPCHGEKPGLGLGLAITDRLARLLGHEVSVRSRPGRGTMVRIEGAVAKPPTIDTEAADLSELPGEQSTTAVLLVGDDDGDRTAMAAMLSGWRYNVLVASTSDEAARLVADLSEPPDIIVVDVASRGSDNGIEAIRYINRRTGRKIPALIVSADSNSASLQELAECNIMIFQKPIKPDLFRRALEGLVLSHGDYRADSVAHIAVSHTLTEGLR